MKRLYGYVSMWGLTWLGDGLKVKHENEERAEARRQEQASSSGHPHPEARLWWQSTRPFVAVSTRFIRDHAGGGCRTLRRMMSLFMSRRKRKHSPSRNNGNGKPGNLKIQSTLAVNSNVVVHKTRTTRCGLCF